jgi:hypothetical protein
MTLPGLSPCDAAIGAQAERPACPAPRRTDLASDAAVDVGPVEHAQDDRGPPQELLVAQRDVSVHPAGRGDVRGRLGEVLLCEPAVRGEPRSYTAIP